MIHTKDQLCKWIEENVTDHVLQQAFERGRIEVVGGVFAPLPTSKNNGWLVNLIGPYGDCYLIAVAEDRKRLGRYYWFRLAQGKEFWSNRVDYVGE